MYVQCTYIYIFNIILNKLQCNNDNIKISHTCFDTVHCVETQQQNTIKRNTTKRVHRAHSTALLNCCTCCCTRTE